MSFGEETTETTSITTDDVIEFIDNWLNGTNKKLEVMHIVIGESECSKLDKERIFNKFKAFPWDSKKRGGRFKFSETFLMISRKDILDCTQGMDIERESDGMLATTMIDDDEFRFYVWHERFPDPSKTQPISYTRMSRNPLFYTGSVQF
uniref:FBA_2 domain-containing protein n=1 Tax=Caenorhabditis tropicalis TaxID=1561998 RepID=A0A1I7T3U3_9PELO